MRGLIAELWLEIRGHRIPPPSLRGKAPDWSADEELEIVFGLESHLDRDDDFPSQELLEPIAGTCVEIVYVDSKGREAARRITCRSVVASKGLMYLDAYCHERDAPRRFRCDRIQEVIDVETGECLAGDDFLAEYRVDRQATAGLTYGLSIKEHSRFLNALRVLAFMSRCDHEWHPLEMAEIENFIASYWLRLEVIGEPPMDDILRKVRRMSPQPEEFFVALQSVAEHPKLARLTRERLRDVVAADGIIASEETFWGSKVDAYLSA